MAKFEAKSKTTPESCRALAKATLGRRLKRRTLAAGAVAVLALAFAIAQGQARILTLVILAASLALLFFFVRTPSRMARKMMQNTQDASLETLLRFEEDRITTKNRIENGYIGYDAIAGFWTEGGYFLFYLKNDAAFAIARADFIKGDPDRFEAFIREKSGATISRKAGRAG